MSDSPHSSWPSATLDSADELENSLVSVLETAARHGRAAEAWDALTTAGTPIMHPSCGAASFLFRLPAGAPATSSVHLRLNRLTDKENADRGVMRRIADTPMWVRTLDLPPTYRGSYGFQLVPPGRSKPHSEGPPPHNSCRTLPDPHARAQLTQDGSNGLSIVAGSAAEAQPHWPASPRPEALTALRGTLITDTLRDHTGTPLQVYLYLPETSPEIGSHTDAALLTLFDAETWFPRLQLPAALEAAGSALPRLTVFGVCCESIPQRIQRLGANHEFLEFISSVGTTWAVETARTKGVRINLQRGNVLAGQSLGGLSCLYAARHFPERYSAVIAQSPSLWWTPDGASAPKDLSIQRNDWITTQFWSTPSARTPLPRIFLDVGARENITVARLHVLSMALDAARWPFQLQVYDGGHDYACWRGALFNHLTHL